VLLGLPEGLVPVVELAEGVVVAAALADGVPAVVALADGVVAVVALADGVAAVVALADGVVAVVALADGVVAVVALADGAATVVAAAAVVVALATPVPEATTPALYSRVPGSLQATHTRTDSNGRVTRVRGVVRAMVVLLVANACSSRDGHPSRRASGTLAKRNLPTLLEWTRAGACKLPQC
jgi:hypothetical protein